MGIKFDGKNVKKRSRVVANMRNNTELNKGFGTGQVLGNIKRRNVIKSGRNTSGVSLCNIKDGENIRLGSSSSGKILIKIADAKKQIGTSQSGPSVALVWWFYKMEEKI